MQTLKDVAQQARSDARVLASSGLTVSQQLDVQAFEKAARHAENARYWRGRKAQVVAGTASNTGMKASEYEALARKAERQVREIALQSEIRLQRRHDDAQADRAMLGIMLGAVA